MVNTHQLSLPHPLLLSLAESLQQLVNHTISSHNLVQIAEELHWSLIEGQDQGDRSSATDQLRGILSDITLQWETLLGNLHGQPDIHASPEFPIEWIHQWLTQIQSIESSGMPEPSKPHLRSEDPVD
jgi:hypothetical protein